MGSQTDQHVLLPYVPLMLSVHFLRDAIFERCWDRQAPQAILFLETGVDGEKWDTYCGLAMNFIFVPQLFSVLV